MDGTRSGLSAQEKAKVNKYLVTVVKHALDLSDKLYLVNDQGYRVDIPVPFRKAVDIKIYPQYAEFIKDPMDLSKMKKRIETLKSMYLNASDTSTVTAVAADDNAGLGNNSNCCGGGAQFVSAVLRDMDLIRGNAHAFNIGDEGYNIRVMVDYLRNYFRYCVRVFLTLLKEISRFNDCLLKYDVYLFDSPEIQTLMQEDIAQDTRAYLHYPEGKDRLSKSMDSHNLVESMLGINRFPQELRVAIESMCEVPSAVQTSFFRPVVGLAPAAANTTAASTTTTTIASTNIKKAALNSNSNNVNSNGNNNCNTSATKRKWTDTTAETTATVAVSVSGKNKKKPRLSVAASLANSSFDVLDYKNSNEVEEVVDDLDDWADTVQLAETSSSIVMSSSAKKTSTTAATASAKKITSSSSRKSISSSVTTAAMVSVEPHQSSSGRSTEWYKAAEDVVKLLLKHPYVDQTKPTVAADFLNPVVEVAPNVAHDYLQRIALPMDFTTLQHLLEIRHFDTPEQFYVTLRLIFENAIEFNKDNAAIVDYSRLLVGKSVYLLDYTRWLCLERLPLSDSINSNNNNGDNNVEYNNHINYGETREVEHDREPTLLTVEERTKARREREDLVFPASFREFTRAVSLYPDIAKLCSNVYKECKAVMAEVCKCSRKKDEEEVAWFSYPVNIDHGE
jgi:hypothetical protein